MYAARGSLKANTGFSIRRCWLESNRTRGCWRSSCDRLHWGCSSFPLCFVFCSLETPLLLVAPMEIPKSALINQHSYRLIRYASEAGSCPLPQRHGYEPICQTKGQAATPNHTYSIFALIRCLAAISSCFSRFFAAASFSCSFFLRSSLISCVSLVLLRRIS